MMDTQLQREIFKLKAVTAGASILFLTFLFMSILAVTTSTSASQNGGDNSDHLIAEASGLRSHDVEDTTADPGVEIDRKEDRSNEREVDNEEPKSVATPPEPVEPTFDNLDGLLEAQAAVVFDVSTGRELFSYNSTIPRPLASLTKLMTAVVATETVPGDTVVSIQPDYLGQYGSSGLRIGEEWTVRDLVDISLLSSLNDAAYAVGTVVGTMEIPGDDPLRGHRDFIRSMNEKAAEIGMTDTRFSSTTGLDLDDDQSTADGSSEDVLALVRYVLEEHPDLLEVTSHTSITRESLSGIQHTFDNTNQLISSIPRVIGSKTGYTDTAGGNLMVVFEPRIGHPVIAVVLGSTFSGRFSDMMKVVEAVNGHFE